MRRTWIVGVLLALLLPVAGARETAQWLGDPAHPLASAGNAARDAKLAPSPAPFPRILLSHGTGGSALAMA